jgi:hypothetical protein
MKSEPKQKREAIQRGMEFMYGTACDPQNFETYGYDYLSSFHDIAATSKDEKLRRTALQMGRERAQHWRRTNAEFPPEIDADTVTHLVFGNDAADRLGFRDSAIKAKIRRAAKNFTPLDYFWFDAVREPPPSDVPEPCECESENPRGYLSCRTCKKSLEMMSRYEVWVVALVRSYIGERYGVKLGSRYHDVLKWLPVMRPYGEPTDEYSLDFIWSLYAITHVVYTLNGYGVYNLMPEWLPDEFLFLKKHLIDAIDMDDPETVGEILDAVKAFGLTSQASLIRAGEEFLLSRQNSDGSWGEIAVDDIYERYHPTLTAIDGLRQHNWRGPGLCFQEVKSLLSQNNSVAATRATHR